MRLLGVFFIFFSFLVIQDRKAHSANQKPNNFVCNCNYGANSKLLLSNIHALLAEIKKINKKGNLPHNCLKVPRNCAEVLKCGGKQSGVYIVDPDGKGPFKLYCDQKTTGGGWAVFQKRQDGSVDFYRGWDDYKRGFGDLKGEFWLGLDKIYRLTHQTRNSLRIELEDFRRSSAYAEYNYFAVSSERSKYTLSLGTYSGTAGDSLSGDHRGKPFSTKDHDNDSSKGNCAKSYKGAWWYKGCLDSNLNGLYLKGPHSSVAQGINWRSWKGLYYSAKRAEMKMRPV